jgi:hypothetical protein
MPPPAGRRRPDSPRATAGPHRWGFILRSVTRGRFGADAVKSRWSRSVASVTWDPRRLKPSRRGQMPAMSTSRDQPLDALAPTWTPSRFKVAWTRGEP